MDSQWLGCLGCLGCEENDGDDRGQPGDNVAVEVKLDKPVAIETGMTFSVREGGITVGSGRITQFGG